MSVGLTSISHTAVRSMEVVALALSVASHNIANERTPGYTKQRLVVQPAINLGDWSAKFLIGSGVEAVTVEAVRDRLLEDRLRQEISSKSGDELLNGKLRDIEVLFNDAADTGMLPEITKFFNSFHSLALDPSSINFREQVRIAADDLTRSFSTRGEELRRIQTVADENLKNHIDKVRSLASRVAGLSADIGKQESGGQTANDLRDQRNVLVWELSEYIAVTETNSEDFQLMAGDAVLVFDRRSAPIVADTSGPSGFAAVKIGPKDVSSSIMAGRIYAEQQIRDKYVPDYLDKLDQLAFEITQQVNAIHSVSYDGGGNTGVDFFEPLGVAADAARQIKLSAAIQGDLNTIAAAAQAAGKDNEAATEMGNLIHKQVFSGGSIVDQYRSLVFKIGNDTTNAAGNLDRSAALLHQMENRRDSLSAVSIDEETMKVLQFQRSYQASAHMIKVVDELIQTILATAIR